jgi:uroporphyrinogen decarboxylase
MARIGFDMVVSRHRLLGHGQKILGPVDEAWEPRWLDESSYVGEWGEVRRVTAEMHTPVDGMISSLADLDDFELPDPMKEGRIGPVTQAVGALGEETPVFALLHDAFELPWMMRGSITRLVTDYHRDPRLAKKLARISTDFSIEMAKILLDEGVAGIVTGDESGPFMTPGHFDTFIQPYLRELIRAVHAKGAPFIKHTDGMIWPILESIVRTGPDVLNPIQTEAGMLLPEVKTRYGSKIALMGNVDCGPTLHYGSVEDVSREVSRCLRDGAPGGGFILSSSNTIYKGTRPENLRAMIGFNTRTGRY